MTLITLDMNQARIIALCGSKRCGKDTVANYISENYGYTNVKFAGKLKDICKTLFDFTDDQVEADVKDAVDPRYNKTPREILQFFGTEMMQFKLQEFLPSVGRLFWARNLLESTKNTSIIISDMRFIHEADQVIAYDPKALIIRVKRPTQTLMDDTHVSETEVNNLPFHETIDNDGSIENLHEKIRAIMQKHEISASAQATWPTLATC